MSKLTVIIPVYNTEKYLKRCIESVINQTFLDLEIILVDDGSTDQSASICDDYARRDNRIKVIHKTNGGLSDARNTGIKEATSECISFVDSDDWLALDIYDYTMKLQKMYQVDIVEFGIIQSSAEKEEFQDREEHEELYICTGIEMLPRIYQDNLGGSIAAWNKIFRRDLFENNLFTKGRIMEDTLLMPKIFYAASKCLATSRTGYYYYQGNQESITKRQYTLKNLDAIYAHGDNRKFFLENGLDSARLWSDTTYAFSMVNHLKKTKQYYGRQNEKYLKLKKQYAHLLKEFMRNPYFMKKQKLLLIFYEIIL